MAKSLHGTRADDTYAAVRADILAGRLAPGERLRFPELADRYGVGVGVLREGLTRLTAEGLVRSQPHLGYEVTPISADALIELTEARIDIEGMALRRSLADGDTAWEADLIAKHHMLQSTPQYDPEDPARVSDHWTRVHSDFHQALLAGCANRRLLEIALSLRDAAELYRYWSQQTARHPNRNAAAEHQQLLELALARDADGATEALARHISATTEILLNSQPAQPEESNELPDSAV